MKKTIFILMLCTVGIAEEKKVPVVDMATQRDIAILQRDMLGIRGDIQNLKTQIAELEGRAAAMAPQLSSKIADARKQCGEGWNFNSSNGQCIAEPAKETAKAK